ncbi:MAG: hemolysin III family protein [Bdellovibrionales bacterium]|nr:hemolysin III family protein [Bdellovibrionales bacterium]
MTHTFEFIGFSEPFSSWSHLLAAVGFLYLGIPLLKKGQGNGLRVFSLAVFTFSLVFLFSMSGVFHLLERNTTGWEVLQRLDHAAIWVLIAGSFTPVHIILFRGFWRWGFLLLIWTVAITGLVLKTIFFADIPNWASATMFLGLGWMGALSAWKVIHVYGDRSIRYLLYSALSYTFGTVLDYFVHWPILINGVVGPHEVFHVCVIAGASYHWLWVYSWANCPVVARLEFKVTEFPGNHFVAKARGEAITISANSIDQLKKLIQKKTSMLYHHKLPAEEIHLKYSREEIL